MRLYYFTSEAVAKLILEERCLKLSRIDELNDPFELLGANIGKRKAREVANYARTTLSQRYGIICMSSSWKSPVMWAHYAEKHKGVCLGFDVRKEHLKQVDYLPGRLDDLLSENPKLSDFNIEKIYTLFTTKASEWSYENEWRFIYPLDQVTKNKDGNYLLPFNEHHIHLREVILGCRCEWQIPNVKRAIGKVPLLVEITKARPAFTEYKMVKQRQQKPIKIVPTAASDLNRYNS